MPAWPRTVYVIDDEKHVARAIARLLRSASMEAVELSCVSDLLAVPSLDPEGCVVSDIRMPGECGLTIPRRLAQHGTSLPVIFVTALEDEEMRAEAARIGAVACLKKPVDQDELLSAIAKAGAQKSGASGGSILRLDDYR